MFEYKAVPFIATVSGRDWKSVQAAAAQLTAATPPILRAAGSSCSWLQSILQCAPAASEVSSAVGRAPFKLINCSFGDRCPSSSRRLCQPRWLNRRERLVTPP